MRLVRAVSRKPLKSVYVYVADVDDEVIDDVGICNACDRAYVISSDSEDRELRVLEDTI